MTVKKVLVTGSNGLLGQKLTDIYLKEEGVRLVATGKGENRHVNAGDFIYEDMDICDPQQVQLVFEKHKPDAVIHGAAMTHVDHCELDPEKCRQVNVEATRILAQNAEQIGAHFIFVSTDFIFDGEDGPYKEDDEPAPLSIYGWSKLDAENIVKEVCSNWAIARTVLVFGVNNDMSRSNIVLWAKGALEKGALINVVDDQVRSPTLAEDLAKGCYLIERKGATGVYNISGKDIMSIYDLVQRVAEYFRLSMESVSKITSESLGQPAKRPPVTGFDLMKSRQELGYEPHSFEEGIALIMQQMKHRQ